MSFQQPVYDHRAYYIFHKETGRIVHSHRFMTIRGDDSVLKKVTEESLLAAAAAHTGHSEAKLGVHLEIGEPSKSGHITGYDLRAKALIIEARPQKVKPAN